MPFFSSNFGPVCSESPSFSAENRPFLRLIIWLDLCLAKALFRRVLYGSLESSEDFFSFFTVLQNIVLASNLPIARELRSPFQTLINLQILSSLYLSCYSFFILFFKTSRKKVQDS